MHGPAPMAAIDHPHRYRRDIDGLRALAILPVLLFHAHAPGFSGGYVGVDIFFVISGFLITGILARDIDQGRFSLARFYERRFRRIIPALALMILVTLALAAWLYLPGDLEGVPRSALAATLFASNLWFFTDTGYFAGGADVILIPEIPFTLDHVLEQIEWRTSIGRRSTIVCVAEGACMEGGEQVVHTLDPTSPDPVKLGGIGERIAQEIDRRSDVEARAVTLGHVQRGGSPVADDRVLGTLFGAHATHLLLEGASNRMVAWRGGAVGDVDITVPGQGQRVVPEDDPHVLAARACFTTFGDEGPRKLREEARGRGPRGLLR